MRLRGGTPPRARERISAAAATAPLSSLLILFSSAPALRATFHPCSGLHSPYRRVAARSHVRSNQMVYRGEDLDLRTPQMGIALGRDLAGGGSGEPAANGTRVRTGAARSLPIWVDGTVLACCNQAYEIAGAHRAGEVRPE